MKKTLSLVLSILMLISTFSIASFNAFAYPTMAEAPEVKVGDTFAVEYNSLATDTYEYYAKFVPEETGYYEFKFDTGVGKISGEVDVYIFTKSGKDVNYDYMDEDYPNAVTVAAKLTKGFSYYLAMEGYRCGTYKSNVTLQKHTHKMVTTYEPACYIKDDEFFGDVIEDGAVYSVCEGGCYYSVKKSTIYAPNKMLLSKATFVYDGARKKPTVTVKDRKGNTIKSSNYKVTYSNNLKVGTGTVKVTFNYDSDDDKYVGEMVRTITINPKGTKLAKLTKKSKAINVKWNKQSVQTSGYQVQVATDSKFTKNKKTVTVSGTSNTSKTITGLKAKQRYYVRVRTYKTVNNKKYYSSWSGYRYTKTKK